MTRLIYGMFISFVLTPVHLAGAQNFHDAMLKLHKQYQGQSDLSIAMNVNAFETESASTPYYEVHVAIKKSEQNYRYQMGSNEMLMNDKYIIMVDHSLKEVVWSRRDPSTETDFKEKIKFNLDSILNFYEDGRYVGTKDNIDNYSVLQKTGDIRKIDLYIDRSSDLLTRLTYGYRSNQFVSIDFLHFESKPAFDKNTFDEHYFFQSGRNTPSLSSRFTGYRLIDVNDKKNRSAVTPKRGEKKISKN
ncbi:hypothetical protein BH09BAC3_BH09BAC3_35190 [soil metagenome]